MSLQARRVAQAHKIVGLVAGFLLLFWTMSGLFFTLFPIETIRGDPWRPAVDHGDLGNMTVEISVSEAMAAAGGATKAELKPFLGDPVWIIHGEHTRDMIDARTGERLSPLPRSEIDRYVAAFGPEVTGLGQLSVIYEVSENALREYGGPLPVWVIEYEPNKQRIYIDAGTGDIRAVRTTRWRIFDVLWRFHILDITGDDRFDSWWLKLAAFLGLTMVLSGITLMIDRIVKGRLFR